MPAFFNIEAIEGGTAIISVTFYDHADPPQKIPMKPGLKWSLYRRDGSYVNSRQDVEISPDTTVYIVLTGDDLPAGTLFLLIEGTYDAEIGDATYTDLNLREEFEFKTERTIN